MKDLLKHFANAPACFRCHFFIEGNHLILFAAVPQHKCCYNKAANGHASYATVFRVRNDAAYLVRVMQLSRLILVQA